jgi:hypothetical protein
MNIWQFQDRLTRWLTGWAVGNIVVGAVLMVTADGAWRGVGEMAVAWGAINLAIALFGQRSSKRRRSAADGMTPGVMQAEQRKLSRLLWVNAGLDILYILGGVWLAQTRGATDLRLLGWGWCVVVQGAFLFVFDLVNALLLARLPQPATPQNAARPS